MSSTWVSDSFPTYRLAKGAVLKFLKDKFSDNGKFGDTDFGLTFVLDDWTFRAPRKLTSEERKELQTKRRRGNDDENREEALQKFFRFLEECRKTGISGTEHEIVHFCPESDLRKYFAESDHLEGILRCVLPSTGPLPVRPTSIKTQYTRVFAILLSISRGSFIRHFVRFDSLSDENLPFDSCPEAFPLGSEGVDARFFQEFQEHQWTFCAPSLSYERSKHWQARTILPIVCKVQLGTGGSSDTYRIELHPDYNFLDKNRKTKITSTDPCPNTFVLKTYNSIDAETRCRNEVDGFVNVRSAITGIGEPSIIGFYGSYKHGKTWNIILEYANDNTLEDYFGKHMVPCTGPEIYGFWESLLSLNRVLDGIHHLVFKDHSVRQGWHQDVKPRNILVSTRNGRLEFKLADLGLSHFLDKSGETVHGRDTQGTRTYGAPECYIHDSINAATRRLLTSKVDIWSLGCVLSEAAVWLALGPRGLHDYRDLRSENTKECGIKDSDCFHDGEGILKCVKEYLLKMHGYLRTCDRITLPVLSMIIDDMLIPPLYRSPANTTWWKFAQLLEHSASMKDDNPNYVEPSSPADSVVSAVFSDNSIRGSSISSYSEQDAFNASRHFASLLMNDEILLPLYLTAFASPRIGPDRFQRNFRRLLRLYSKGLQNEAKDKLQNVVANFVRSHADEVARIIRNTHEPEDQNKINQMHSLKFQEVEREGLSRYLRSETESYKGIKCDKPEEEFDSESDNMDPEEQPELVLDALNVAENFLLSCQSFQTLRQNFGDLVHGVHQTDLNARATKEMHQNQDDDQKGTDNRDAPSFSRVWIKVLWYAINSMYAMFRNIISFGDQPLKLGMRRVRWTCTCGASLYDDFLELQSGSLEELEKELNAPNAALEKKEVGMASKILAVVFSVFRYVRHPHCYASNYRLREGTGTNGAQRMETNEAVDATLQPTIVNIRDGEAGDNVLFLLLCINIDHSTTELLQNQLCTIISDRLLFKLLRHAYHSRRKSSWYNLPFRGLRNINFVRFSVDMESLVDVDQCGKNCLRNDCGCRIPPEYMVNGTNPQYHYDPVPKQIPPIGSNYLKHWLQDPHGVPRGRTSTLNLMPKKIGKLAVSPSSMTTGWGIHFEEGFCWSSRGVFAMMAPIPASLLFGVLWSSLHGDVQGGFSVATYIFGVSMWLLTWVALAVQSD